MRTSDNGIARIKQREGVRYKTYLDSKGIPTIGVGHTGRDVLPQMVATEAQVDTWLRSDLKTAESAVNKVKVPLTQNQYDALVSFVFNVGASAFIGSTMFKVLNLGNYTEAAYQFDRWHIPSEITPRRDSERDQFKAT